MTKQAPRHLAPRHMAAMGGARREQLARGVMQHSDLGAYKVTMDGWEVTRHTLYDDAVYDGATGHAQLSFFQTPAGQAGKTLEDTNMTNAGMLPKNEEFLIEAICIQFWPIVPPEAGFNPSDEIAPGAIESINDVYAFRQRGFANLRIASRDYVTVGPLGDFPAMQHFDITGAMSDSTTAGAAQMSYALFADMKGRPYYLRPYSLLLEPNQSFAFSLNWPAGPLPLPSAKNAKVYVKFEGLRFRNVQ